jgi:hypothetical protein
MKLNKLILLVLIFSPTLSYAFFCPTNFNQIDFGYTTDQVQQECGKPDKQETKDGDVPVPQEWSYFIPQTVALSANQNGQGTLKTTVTFDKSGKAINLSVNGLGVGASSICGKSIQLGDTLDAVKSACGEPSFINKQANPTSPTGSEQPPKKITTFTYNTNPSVILTFENGKLTSKK